MASSSSSTNRNEGKVLKRANPSTIQDKFMVGYQGWFTCPGDGDPVDPGHHGWLHWFNAPIPDGGHPNTDVWPDVSAYSPSELFPAPGLKTKNGDPVFLFSSRNAKTVQRHFHWMAEHGIDGAFLQRFVQECDVEAGKEGIRRIRDEVGDRVREAAEREGRVFAIMYDVAGTPANRLLHILQRDWAHLVREKGVLDSPNYLKEKGKPVIALWGLGFEHAGHTPQLVHAITQFFRNTTPGGVYILGGAPAHWRTSEGDADRNPEFVNVWMNEFDAISPWTIGRYTNDQEADHFMESKMKGDVELIKQHNERGAGRKIDYIPVVHPGGSGYNMTEGKWKFNDAKRRGGRFLWKQIANAKKLGVRTIYGAMWDEYDEGTAFMPIVESKRNLPESDKFRFMALDEDGYDCPPDWYMRVCGFAAEGVRNERQIFDSFPVKELQDYWSSRPKFEEVSNKSGEFISGVVAGAGGSGDGDGQTYQEWLLSQKEEKGDLPPPPYTLIEDEVTPRNTAPGPALAQTSAVPAAVPGNHPPPANVPPSTYHGYQGGPPTNVSSAPGAPGQQPPYMSPSSVPPAPGSSYFSPPSGPNANNPPSQNAPASYYTPPGGSSGAPATSSAYTGPHTGAPGSSHANPSAAQNSPSPYFTPPVGGPQVNDAPPATANAQHGPGPNAPNAPSSYYPPPTGSSAPTASGAYPAPQGGPHANPPANQGAPSSYYTPPTGPQANTRPTADASPNQNARDSYYTPPANDAAAPGAPNAYPGAKPDARSSYYSPPAGPQINVSAPPTATNAYPGPNAGALANQDARNSYYSPPTGSQTSTAVPPAASNAYPGPQALNAPAAPVAGTPSEASHSAAYRRQSHPYQYQADPVGTLAHDFNRVHVSGEPNTVPTNAGNAGQSAGGAAVHGMHGANHNQGPAPQPPQNPRPQSLAGRPQSLSRPQSQSRPYQQSPPHSPGYNQASFGKPPAGAPAASALPDQWPPTSWNATPNLNRPHSAAPPPQQQPSAAAPNPTAYGHASSGGANLTRPHTITASSYNAGGGHNQRPASTHGRPSSQAVGGAGAPWGANPSAPRPTSPPNAYGNTSSGGGGGGSSSAFPQAGGYNAHGRRPSGNTQEFGMPSFPDSGRPVYYGAQPSYGSAGEASAYQAQPQPPPPAPGFASWQPAPPPTSPLGGSGFPSSQAARPYSPGFQQAFGGPAGYPYAPPTSEAYDGGGGGGFQFPHAGGNDSGGFYTGATGEAFNAPGAYSSPFDMPASGYAGSGGAQVFPASEPWVPGGGSTPGAMPAIPPRPPTHYSSGQGKPVSGSGSGSSSSAMGATGTVALEYARNAVDKIAGQKTRERLETQVGSLAQTGSKLLSKFNK